MQRQKIWDVADRITITIQLQQQCVHIWCLWGERSARYLSGFCVHTCICSRMRWVKVLKHWPHFHRCQSLNSELNWLVEVGLASTRWFLELIWFKMDSLCPLLSRREKLREEGDWGNTIERGRTSEEDLGLLLKDWSVSCRLMASITVVGTFTVEETQTHITHITPVSLKLHISIIPTASSSSLQTQ